MSDTKRTGTSIPFEPSIKFSFSQKKDGSTTTRTLSILSISIGKDAKIIATTQEEDKDSRTIFLDSLIDWLKNTDKVPPTVRLQSAPKNSKLSPGATGEIPPSDIADYLQKQSNALKTQYEKDLATQRDKLPKEPCDCPKCFKFYSEIVDGLIGNLKGVLENKNIDVLECTDATIQEPGCLYKQASWLSEKQAKIAQKPTMAGSTPIRADENAASVQPVNKVSNRNRALVDKDRSKFLDLIELYKSFGVYPLLGEGMGGTYPNLSTNFGVIGGSNGFLNTYSFTAGSFEYFSAKTKTLQTDGGGCKALLDWYANGPGQGQQVDANQLPSPTFFRPGFFKVPTVQKKINDDMGSNWPNYIEYCCKVRIREFLQTAANSSPGGDGLQIGSYSPEMGWGKASPHCSMGTGSTLMLQKAITCCLDKDDLCTPFKCEKNPDTNIDSSINNLIDKLKKIHDPETPVGCLDTLSNTLSDILYGTDGLYKKVSKYIIIDSIFGKIKRKALSGNNYFNGGVQIWLGGWSGITCSDTMLQKIGHQNPPDGTAPWDVDAIHFGDPVLANTHQAYLDAHEPGIQANPCQIPLVLEMPINQIKLKNQTKSIAERYNEIVNEFEEKLLQKVKDLIEGLSTPDIPRANDPKCDEIKKSLDAKRKEREQYANLQAQYEADIKTINDRIKQIQREILNTPNGSDFPPIDENSDDSPKCQKAKREYTAAVTEVNNKTQVYEAAQKTIEEANERLAKLNIEVNKYQILINKTNAKLINTGSKIDDYIPNDLYLEFPESGKQNNTYKRFFGRLATKLTDLQNQLDTHKASRNNQEGNLRHAEENLKNARQKASQLGEAIKKSCNFASGETWDPPKPEKNGSLSKRASLFDQLEKMQSAVLSLYDNINNVSNGTIAMIASLDMLIEDLERSYQEICDPDTSATLESCILSCVKGKIPDLLKQISKLRLNRYDNTKDGPCTQPTGPDLPKPAPTGISPKQGDWVVKTEMDSDDFKILLKKIITDCLVPQNQQTDNQRKAKCAKFDVSINALTKLKTTLEADLTKQKESLDAKIAELRNKQQRNPDLNLIVDDIIRQLKTTNRVMPDPVQLKKLQDSINQPFTEEFKISPNVRQQAIQNFTNLLALIIKFRSIQSRFDRLDMDLKILNTSKTNCEVLATTVQDRCALIRSEFQTVLTQRLAEEEYGWGSFENIAYELLNQDEMNDLTSSVRTWVEETVDSLCYDTRTTDRVNWPTAEDVQNGNLPKGYYGQDPITGKKVQIQPVPSFSPRQAYVEPIADDDISIICRDGKWSHIRILVTVTLWDHWRDDSDINKFWNYIAQILNRTVLCSCPTTSELTQIKNLRDQQTAARIVWEENQDDPSWRNLQSANKAVIDYDAEVNGLSSRASVFHSFYLTHIRGLNPIPKTYDVNEYPEKSNRHGPRWIPGYAIASEQPCESGPYYFPPPNDLQVLAASESGSTDQKPCPNHCTHTPFAPSPQQRFSILRRLFYEGKTLLDYTRNVQNLIANTIKALEEIRPGLKYCADSDHKPPSKDKDTDDLYIAQLPKDTPSKLPLLHSDKKIDNVTALLVASKKTSGCNCEESTTDSVKGPAVAGNGRQQGNAPNALPEAVAGNRGQQGNVPNALPEAVAIDGPPVRQIIHEARLRPLETKRDALRAESNAIFDEFHQPKTTNERKEHIVTRLNEIELEIWKLQNSIWTILGWPTKDTPPEPYTVETLQQRPAMIQLQSPLQPSRP